MNFYTKAKVDSDKEPDEPIRRNVVQLWLGESRGTEGGRLINTEGAGHKLEDLQTKRERQDGNLRKFI